MGEDLKAVLVTTPLETHSSRSLAKAIFKAELPEQFIRTIPAQSLFLAIKTNGLGSSSDIVELATVEQTRLLLDFDCWQGDSFSEDNFWEWLALGDDEEGLKILQKIVRSIDLKLVALLISRHVNVISKEDPSETPPDKGFFTPDGGRTWISLTLQDPSKNFHLGRLLAMIFETNTDLFYQLISTPSVATPSVLEEDAFQERIKRLAAEGVPEPERAAETHAPWSEKELLDELPKKQKAPIIEDVRPIEPLLYDAITPEPLHSAIRQHRELETVEAELSMIMNAALVYWHIDTSDITRIQLLTQQVKGAINIGLEIAFKLSPKSSSSDFIKHIGLTKLYRIGLGKLLTLRKECIKVRAAAVEPGSANAELIMCLTKNFPCVPAFALNKDQKTHSKEAIPLDTTAVAILHVEELEQIKSVVAGIKGNPSSIISS